jgi:phosphatidate cytidylyltransferase
MLKTRVITALALLGIFLCILFVIPKASVPWVFGLVAALAAWEWAGLLSAGQTLRVAYAVVVSAACLGTLHLAETLFPIYWAFAGLLWLAVIPFWLKAQWSLTRHRILGYVLGCAVIVPTWAALVALHGRGPWVLFGAMALVWVADIAAYFTGRAFGRNRLAPTISPGKTWEGVVGAFVATLIYGFCAAMVVGIPVAANLGWAAFLPVLTAVSIIGDLFESMIKRQAGVKDSSHLLPGHGGVLDRIDSQTSTLPLVALALEWGSR